MKYQVLDNNMPADCSTWSENPNSPWLVSRFDTPKEAFDYAYFWLGSWGEGLALELNIPQYYSSWNLIEVQEVKES